MPVELPEDVLPRVVELDATDKESVLGFAREYGVLGFDPEQFGTDIDVAAGLHKEKLQASLPQLDTRSGRAAQYGEYLVHFAGGVHVLQAAFCLRRELEQPRFSWRRLEAAWKSPYPLTCPRRRSDAARLLVWIVNAGIATLAPTLASRDLVDYEARTLDQIGARVGGLEFVPAVTEPPTLFSLCSLELYNHILAGRKIRYCANETCGRLFTKHEGRSKYGGSREDLWQYCSRSCSQAQAQREYRRRKKAEKQKTR